MNGSQVLITGEALVDFIPVQPGPLRSVERFSRRVGGAAANVSICLAGLEHPPLFWTCLGVDPFGEYLAASLESHDVDMRFVERDSTAKTGLSFVSHDDSAVPEFTIYREGMADTQLTPGTIEDEVLGQLDWIYVGGVQLSTDPARRATLDLLKRAERFEVEILFDPNYRPDLWDEYDFPPTIEELLPLIDVVKTSADDLVDTSLPTGSAESLAAELCDHGPHTAFVTKGSGGTLARVESDSPFEEGQWRHDGFTVDAVDTTGAGDAFSGGVIAAAVEGMTDTGSVIEFANAVAAISTTEQGAISALPGRSAVAEFLERSSDS